MDAQFQNRREAGQDLAKKLLAYARQPEVLVLGLPRGGIPVAFEVASTYDAVRALERNHIGAIPQALKEILSSAA